jgi:hypothetical protein
VLQSKGKAERRLCMRSRFLVRAALELRNKNSLEHTFGIGIAWSDLIRRGMTTGVKDLLSHRNKDLTAQETDGLVLLLRVRGVQAEADLLELAVYFLPSRWLIEDLGARTELLRRKDRLSRNLLCFGKTPAIGTKLTVVRGYYLPRGIRIRSDDGMDGFAKEAEELLIRCMEQVEAGIVEDPIVLPISPVDPMLVDVGRCRSYPVVCRGQPSEVVQTCKEVILGQTSRPVDAGGRQ